MYGKKQTQHQKETVSKALSGRNITWGEKISKALKGRRSQNKGKKLNLTEEQRKLRSERHKGKIPWNKGKKGVQVAWNKGISNKEAKKRMLINNPSKNRETILKQIKTKFKYSD